MIRVQFSICWTIVVTVWILAFTLPIQAEDEKFDATITLGNGQTTFVKDVRMIYSWREMPANTKGLVPFKEASRVEQGILIAGGAPDQPRFQLIPFRELDSIEFDCDIQQLRESMEHEFRVQRIWLKRSGGERAGYSAELLGSGHPVFWPQSSLLSFPDNANGRQIDRRTVQIRGVTKIEGQDSEYAFVFPVPSSIGIQSVVKKQRDLFPRIIRFSHAETAGVERAKQ